MPELPEVETTLQGLAPHLLQRQIERVILRRPDLRWPIPPEISLLAGATIQALSRRAKYLLMDTSNGTAIWHLGMSGHMRVLSQSVAPRAHDHVDWLLDNGTLLRFNDPRRFGALLWSPLGVEHSLLASLGPEPLSPAFTGEYLYARSRKRSVTVKQFLMSQDIVVGVGNIYANEALFMAGIHPLRKAGAISLARYLLLESAVRDVLSRAIAQGGTTLKDFISPDGGSGYFSLSLSVYGRGGEPCVRCGSLLRSSAVGGRATVWCPVCQR